ncbi:glycosyltransferase [Vibrio cyclitrophicus]
MKSLIKILVVNYNKKIVDTLTSKAIAKIKNKSVYEIIVWDNSTILEVVEFNRKHCIDLGYTFLSEGNNVSLSYLYNKVVKYLTSEQDEFYLCIFDDDSSPTHDYFSEVESICDEGEVLFFAPKVSCNSLLYSPALYKPFRNEAIKIDNGLCFGPAVGVMSGTVVNSDVFKKVNFDEALMFYGIDTKFYLDITYRENIPLFIMKYELQHSLSVSDLSELPEQEVLRRFLNVKGASSYINKGLGAKYLFSKTVIDFFVSLKLAFKYRNISFINKGTYGLSKNEN